MTRPDTRKYGVAATGWALGKCQKLFRASKPVRVGGSSDEDAQLVIELKNLHIRQVLRSKSNVLYWPTDLE